MTEPRARNPQFRVDVELERPLSTYLYSSGQAVNVIIEAPVSRTLNTPTTAIPSTWSLSDVVSTVLAITVLGTFIKVTRLTTDSNSPLYTWCLQTLSTAGSDRRKEDITRCALQRPSLMGIVMLFVV
ncbi:hypothetical protein BDN72DRAFT_864536 [Pluteus cervinus]|uniref:Uncharacterized protein n=1 Tax=Pluteus cervinus TaxID=181527 RepID=A0ACD3A3Q3_9AGAR|nr:hypothetical protein BDN72DRAFT_864536 [Pluteus cervinus]